MSPQFFRPRTARSGAMLSFLCAATSLFCPPAHAATPPAASPQPATRNIVVHGRTNTANTARATTNPSVPANVPTIIAPSTTVAKPSANTARSSTHQPYLFSLRVKPIMDAGAALADKGVYFTGWNYATVSNVPSGGVQRGFYYDNLLGLGTDLDMQRIAHIPGAKIHFFADLISGRTVTNSTLGGLSSGSSWATVFPYGAHLQEFTWDQALFHDKLFILAGRAMPKGSEFEGSELYCLFPGFLCSVPTTMTINGSMPAFVTSTWATRVMYKPTQKTYVKTAIWESEPWLKANNHNSWPGPDWGFDKTRGEDFFSEGGYKTNFTNDLYPRAYDIGFLYDTAIYNDPLFNTKGTSRPLTGGKPMPRRGRTQLWLQAQQMVWKPDVHDTRGLIVFGAANIMTSGDAPVKDGFVTGLFDWGPFAGRPRDFLSLNTQILVFDHRFVQGMTDTLVAHKHDARYGTFESMTSLAYGAAVAPGVTFAPYVEYFRNPDQIGVPTLRPNVKNALQVGAFLVIQLSPALGVPTLHRIRY